MVGRKSRQANNSNSSTNGNQSNNMHRSTRSPSGNYNHSSSTGRTGDGMGAASPPTNSNLINGPHPRSLAQQPLTGFDKTMAEIKGKLDDMKIFNESQNKQSNSTSILSAATSTPEGKCNSQYTGIRRKKTKWSKLDLASGEIVPNIKEQPSLAELNLPSGPATALLPFRKLPIELRLKIWGHAARHPRFIEIEYGPKVRDGEDLGSVLCAGEHWRHRVAPRSRQPPAILHVCKEVREEAQKIYQCRTFDTMTMNQSERYIYYNPQCDIIYFGDETCVSNMVSLFCQEPRQPIPRVAINLSAKGSQCCDWDDWVYGVDDGITVMQILHGIFPPVVREDDTRFPGCLGLEEVFWVVQSNLWRLAPGNIDSTVSMRHATTNGLTKGQQRFKKSTLWDMKCIDDETWSSGTNLWADNKPKFSFISFAPHPRYDGISTTCYDGLGINTPAVNFLRRNGWTAVKKIEDSTGCIITAPPQSYPGEEPREIGFMGKEKSIAKAKELVLKELATCEGTILTKVADTYQDAWDHIREVREGEL